jgi:hypothetical protein
VTVLDEQPLAQGPPPRLKGPALALRLGGLMVQGDVLMSSGRGPALDGALEAAWDVDRVWSFFLEGGWYQSTIDATTTFPHDPDFKSFHTHTVLNALPLTAGFTILASITRGVGLRFRVGGAGAAVTSTSSVASGTAALVAQEPHSAWAFGFVAGVGCEPTVGPGRVIVEARYTLLRTNLGLAAGQSGLPFNAQPGDVGGAQLLAGYRLEL